MPTDLSVIRHIDRQDIFLGRRRSTLQCPKCGKTGILRLKKTRGNNEYGNARWNEYRYFQHFDYDNKKNTSCYVENILKEKGLDKYPDEDDFSCVSPLDDEFRKFFRLLERIGEKFNETRFDTDDKKILLPLLQKATREFQSFMEPLILYEFLLKLENKTPELENLTQEIKEYIDCYHIASDKCCILFELFKKRSKIDPDDPKIKKVIRDNANGFNFFYNRWGSLFNAVEYWFQRYEKPKRLKKREALNKKLSESAFGSEKYPGSIC